MPDQITLPEPQKESTEQKSITNLVRDIFDDTPAKTEEHKPEKSGEAEITPLSITAEKEPAPPAKAEKPVESAPKKEAKKDNILDLTKLAPDFTKASTPEQKKEGEPEFESKLDMPADPPAHWGSKQKADYKRWRENQLDMERQLWELKHKPAPKGELDPETGKVIETLKKENEQLLSRLESHDLYNSPRFQAKFVEPRKKLFLDAQTIAKEYGSDPAKFAKAMSLTGKDRVEILDEIRDEIESSFMRDKFNRLVDGIDEKTAEIGEALKNSKETSDKVRQEEMIARHEQGKKSEAQLRQLSQAAKQSMIDELGFDEFYQRTDDPNYSWWNEGIENSEKAAEEILLRAGPEQSALASHLAPLALRIVPLYRAERAARIALQKQLDALDESKGDLKDGGSKPGITKEDKEVDFVDAVFSRLHK